MNSTKLSHPEVKPLVDQTARALLEAAPKGTQVILFGSHARGNASEHSDADFLIVEPSVGDAWAETVRLRRAVAKVPLSMDIIVVDRARFEAERNHRNSLIGEAARGRIYRHED